jgi:hypothetical protein
MNTTYPPARSLDRDEQHALSELQSLPQRISPVDRWSLRLGFWLLLRSTRNIARNRAHEEHARLSAAHRAREARERAAERTALLNSVRA